MMGAEESQASGEGKSRESAGLAWGVKPADYHNDCGEIGVTVNVSPSYICKNLIMGKWYWSWYVWCESDFYWSILKQDYIALKSILRWQPYKTSLTALAVVKTDMFAY